MEASTDKVLQDSVKFIKESLPSLITITGKNNWNGDNGFVIKYDNNGKGYEQFLVRNADCQNVNGANHNNLLVMSAFLQKLGYVGAGTLSTTPKNGNNRIYLFSGETKYIK